MASRFITGAVALCCMGFALCAEEIQENTNKKEGSEKRKNPFLEKMSEERKNRFRGEGQEPGFEPSKRDGESSERPSFRHGEKKLGQGGMGNMVEMRNKMLALMQVPDDKLDEVLDKWPKFQEMDDAGREQMKKKIIGFRNERKREALDQAKQDGFNITPEREQEFVGAYWKGRQKMEETLRQEMEPRRKALEQEARESLMQIFGDTQQRGGDGEVSKTDKPRPDDSRPEKPRFQQKEKGKQSGLL